MLSRLNIWQMNFFFLLIYIFIKDVTSMRGGFLYFKFLCYENPGHRDISGAYCDLHRDCDPIFTICISARYINDEIKQSKCDIYYKVTSVFKNEERVCNLPKDNRAELKNEIAIDLPFPLPEKYFIKVEVRDSDSFGSDFPMIATFFEEFVRIPSVYISQPVFEKIQLYRVDYRYRNPQAKLSVSMALKCEENRFGKHCLKFCRATAATTTYSCSNTGDKICKKGWQGPDCTDYDPCAFQNCIKGATCIEVSKQAKCFCNGETGPQCYPNYNPCNPNPCKNYGNCSSDPNLTGRVKCQCNSHFDGLWCENRRDICKLEPCHNNASCFYDQDNNRICHCRNGYKGELCDKRLVIPNNNKTPETSRIKQDKTNGLTIMLIVIIAFILILSIIFVIIFIKRTRARSQLFKEKEKIEVKFGNHMINRSLPNIIENEYFLQQESDTAYEAIDDNNVYVDINFQDENDGYLVPCQTKPDMYNSTAYLEMGVNEDEPSQLFSNTKSDSYYLSSLPTKETKNKVPFIKMFMK